MFTRLNLVIERLRSRARERARGRDARRHGLALPSLRRAGRWYPAFESLEVRLLLTTLSPPYLSTPASLTVAENESTTTSQIYFGDSWAVGYDNVSLSVAHGTLQLNSTNGIGGISGQNSASMTIQATANAWINSLVYSPNPGYTGSDSLQVSVTNPTDKLSSGIATVPIAVVPLLINAPPSWGPVLNEYTPIAGPFNIVDALASGTSDTMTLSAPDGTISLATTSGLSFTSGSNDSSSVSVNGTLANLNAAIGTGFGYIPNGGTLGSDTLQVSVVDANDNASTTLGIPITVSALPPNIELLESGSWAVREDSPGNLLSQAFRAFDQDAVDNSDFLTISATNGTILAPFGSGELNVTAGAYGSSSVTLNGPIYSLLETVDSDLRYAPNPGYTGPDTLQLSLYDSVDGLSTSNSIGINVLPAPTVVGLGSAYAVMNSANTFPGSNFSLIDAAATGTSDSLSLSVQYGSLTLGSTTGLTFTAGSNGASSMTVSGTLANLNGALDSLAYTPNPDNSPNSSPTDTDNLVISVSDSGNNTSGSLRCRIQQVLGPQLILSTEEVSLDVNSSFVFSNGSFAVLDVENSTESIAMSVSDGTLALGSTAGLTVSSGANNSSSMTVSGSLQDINLALNGLVYTPNAGYIGSDTLVSALDGPITVYSPTVPITINGPPIVTAPSTARVDENGVLPFPNGSIAVNDTAEFPASDWLTVSVSHGNLSLLPIPGVAIVAGANNTSSMTVIGSVSDVNAALAGLVYTPSPGFTGWDNLALSVNDQLDGLSGTTNVALAVDSPPSIGVPGSAAVNENEPYTFPGSISVLDATASGTSDTLTLAASHGTLALGSTTGVSFVSGSNGTSSMTIAGTLTNLNAALDGLNYTPNFLYTGSDSLQISVVDAGDNFSGSGSVAIVVNPLVPPAVTAPATASLKENGSYIFSGAAISLADPNVSGTSDSLSLSVAFGKLLLGAKPGVMITSGSNGSSSMTITSTLANLDAVMSGLTYTPNSGFSGHDTLSLALANPIDKLTGSAAVALSVNPYVTAPATATVTENTTYSFSSSSLISATDGAASGTSDSLTLTVLHGKLNLGSTAGLTILSGANGSSSMTIQGTLANLNAALNGLVYAPATGYTGSDTLSATINDAGDTLSGSASVAITVAPKKSISFIASAAVVGSNPAAPSSDDDSNQWAGLQAAVNTLYL